MHALLHQSYASAFASTPSLDLIRVSDSYTGWPTEELDAPPDVATALSPLETTP